MPTLAAASVAAAACSSTEGIVEMHRTGACTLAPRSKGLYSVATRRPAVAAAARELDLEAAREAARSSTEARRTPSIVSQKGRRRGAVVRNKKGLVSLQSVRARMDGFRVKVCGAFALTCLRRWSPPTKTHYKGNQGKGRDQQLQVYELGCFVLFRFNLLSVQRRDTNKTKRKKVRPSLLLVVWCWCWC